MKEDPARIDDDELVAAALAAVQAYLHSEAPMAAPARPAWSMAAALEAQGQPPARGHFAAWGSASRAARADRWSYGIVGL